MKKPARVARIRAGSSCWSVIATNGPPTAAAVPETPVSIPATNRLRGRGSKAGAYAVARATARTSSPTRNAISRVLATATTHTPTGVSSSRPARAARRLTQSTSRHVPRSCSSGITNPHTSIEPGISSGASQITNGAATTTIPNPTLACTTAPTSTAVPSTSTRPSVGSGTATT